MQAKPIPGATVALVDENDLWSWNVTIDGPEGTPFLGGKFVVNLDFNDNYPFKNPKVKYLTKIYHPNVSAEGQICMQAIENNWVPTRNANFVIEYLLTMIKAPEPENPQDNDIAEVYKNKYAQWQATAAEWTVQYATQS